MITSEGKAATGTHNVSASQTNGLLPTGTYTFDSEGKLITDYLGLLSLSVTCGEASQVNWYCKPGTDTWYLFLPAYTDLSKLVVSFETVGDAPVICNDSELTNGGETNVFSSGNVTLSCNGHNYSVVVLQGSVGAVHIDTYTGSLEAVHLNKEYKESGEITIVDENGNVQYSGDLDYIKGRGNSTWNGEKKPYNIKLDKKADLFKMGKSKKWCLLANAADSSLLRNPTAYGLAQSLGVISTPDTKLVDLYANGQYMGVYLLTEKVEIDENRVNITDLEKATEDVNEKALELYSQGGEQNSQQANTYQYVNIPNDPENITGGYLLELEKIYRYPVEASGFITSRLQSVVVKAPEYASKAQVEYIRDYYQKMEDAVYSPTGYNADGKYYTEYLDVASLAAMYIVEEFGVNFDGCSSSFYLYKDVDGKICGGPAWDFDIAFGEGAGLNELINDTTNKADPESLYIQHCYIGGGNKRNNAFLAQLFTHEDFQQLVQSIWNDSFAPAYAKAASNADTLSASAQNTVVMNSIRWNTFGSTDNREAILNSYQSKVQYVKNFMATRYAFLSNAYAADTYFVKYDIGTYGKALVHDTTIYASGTEAIVKAAPASMVSNAHFAGWATNPDGTGTVYQPGDKLSVTGNVNLYAQWN